MDRGFDDQFSRIVIQESGCLINVLVESMAN